MPDQQRGDCLSSAGHSVVRTPNMDRLAAEGVRFANAYTTCPICMPARSTALSGLYCHNHGQWNNYGHLESDADTYARRLREAGYHTCHIGKSHYYAHRAGIHLNAYRPFLQALGWTDVLETTGPWATTACDSIMTDHWRKIGCLDTFREDYKRRQQTGPARALWPSPMPPGEHADDFVGRTAVEYLERYDRSEPLLLFVGFGGPHEPWDPPPDWAERYDPSATDPALPTTEPGPWVPEPAAAHQRRLQHDPHGLTPEIVAKIRALYYAKISHVDSWVGRILEALQRRGMLEDTAVVLWSDHGEMAGDKGRLYKAVFYESSVRVPLIVRPPRCPTAGRVAEGVASLADLFPTVLALAGCEAKEEAFGRSLLGTVRDPAARLHDAVFSEIDHRTMIRDERFKLVLDADGAVLKLYDLAEDPQEAVNLVGRDGTAETVARLRERVLAWHLATGYRQHRKRMPDV
jgi:arylsulfatase A-like enzyme